ncbi:hypothetical protein [Klebsiella pneumoniae]|uniref:hypothetical protein n=1 Tax=Klebsiella pneumoniae TaxID=573 RepID=UPI003B3B96DD
MTSVDIYAQWDAKEPAGEKHGTRSLRFTPKHFHAAAESPAVMKGEMPSGLRRKLTRFIAKLQANPAKIASRKTSAGTPSKPSPLLPEFRWLRADLAPSKPDPWSVTKPINEDAAGNYITTA